MSNREYQFKEHIIPVEPPKRPMSAYFLYLQDVRENLFKENPGSTVQDISRLAGDKWRNIDPKTKSKYQKQADEVRDEFDKEVMKYEDKYGKIVRTRRKRNHRGQSARDRAEHAAANSFSHLRTKL